MAYTKSYYAELVLNALASGDRPRDEKIDEREIFISMDEVMNALAGDNFSENYILYGHMDVADHYIATFEDVAITDSDTHSEITLPAKYADLPANQGIYEVFPTNDINERFFVLRSRNTRRRKNLMEGTMEGKVFCYPQGEKLIFNKNTLKVIHTTLTVRLVVTDASEISASATYPVPPNKQKVFVDLVVENYVKRTSLPEDNLSDDVKFR